MKRISIPLWISSVLLYIFMYAPIVVVIVYSFNSAKHGGPWQGFTTEWYGKLLSNEDKMQAAWNTLVLAGVSTAVATVLGTMLGYGLSRYWFPGKKVFSMLMYIPVVIPDIVMAIALVLFFQLSTQLALAAGLSQQLFQMGMTTMIIGHITFEVPFVAIVVRARLVGLDPSLEEAAHDLGADNWRTFWHVTFPSILPGVMSGALLAFTLSLDDFVVSFFTTGPGSTTLPILIYSSVKRGITPDINALSALMVVVSVIGTVGVTLLQRPRKA